MFGVVNRVENHIQERSADWGATENAGDTDMNLVALERNDLWSDHELGIAQPDQPLQAVELMNVT